MKQTKVFNCEQGQAVLLPEECQFTGTEVYIKRIGKGIMLLPVENAWDSLAQSLNQFSDDYMNER